MEGKPDAARLDQEFRVGLVQMCTGRSVEKNLRDASALVREAAGQGAVYVQTPEITTLMEMDRERLFATIRPEAADPRFPISPTGARTRHLAAHRLDADPARAGKVANRSCCSRRRRDTGALRQDPHVRRRAAGRRDLSRIAELPSGNAGVLADLPWGTLGLTVCYDLRFPTSTARSPRPGRFPRHPLGLHPQDRRGALACAAAARAIENGSFVFAARRPAARERPETYGHSLIVNPWGEIIAEAGR
jgi:predicted amidohydrolase